MSQFFYYVPGCGTSISKKELTELGLADRIDKPLCRPCRGKTPDSGSGAVVIQKGTDSSGPIMDMDNQAWRPAPKGTLDSPPYWIGYASADPPGPESLRREPFRNGKLIDLQVGRWLVPVIRNWHEGDEEFPVFWEANLPQVVDFDDSGNAIPGPVIPKYDNLWEESLSVHDQLYREATETGEGGLTFSDMYALAAKYIAVNYRVSLLELSVLRVMSTDDCKSIVRAALDLDRYEEILGNLASRLASVDTDTSSGADRLKTETQTQPAIDPALER